MSSIINCQNISHRFGQTLALNDVNFNVESGEPIALVGPNGAGKTTLFSILCGYLRPTSGRIEVLGHTPGSPALFGQLSALPQDAQLDPRFSVMKQLLFFAKLQGMNKQQALSEANRVLELVGLAQNKQAKPAELSHGMRKRIAIAQALMGSPKLVLLDEPTAGLDPLNARIIRKLISDLSSQTTFMVSSHNLDELEKLCQTVLYLEKGQLTQQQISEVNTHQGFLTVLLHEPLSEEGYAELEALEAVEGVSQTQRMEYVITYDNQLEPYFDQQLLQFFADRSIKYRQLTKGRSLEEQLFNERELNERELNEQDLNEKGLYEQEFNVING